MTVLLSRTSKLWLSTVDIDLVAADATNTTQLTVLNGFKLTQGSKINTLNKFRTGDAPSRANKRYVEDFELVTLTFSTYVKPEDTGNVDVPEKFLWDALTNNGTQQLSDRFEIDFLSSSTNVFPDLWIYLAIDDNLNEGLYKVGRCFVQSVRIQFDINGILKTDWVIKALDYAPLTATPSTFLDMTHLSGYMKTRLSKVTFNRQATDYKLPLLSGGITISNKVIRLSTPTVNTQIAPNPRVRVENRDVVGDFSAYLRTGSGNSADLLNDMLSSTATTNDLANITIDLGSTTGASRLAIEMPTCLIDLPKILTGTNTISTTISMFPQELTHGANDDIKIKIYS